MKTAILLTHRAGQRGQTISQRTSRCLHYLHSYLHYNLNGAGEFKKRNGIFFVARHLESRAPLPLLFIYTLQSFCQIGSRSEMCFIPFHSRPQSQGSPCKTTWGGAGGGGEITKSCMFS